MSENNIEALFKDAIAKWRHERTDGPSPYDILPDEACKKCGTKFEDPDSCPSCRQAWDNAAEELAFRAGLIAGLDVATQCVAEMLDDDDDDDDDDDTDVFVLDDEDGDLRL